MSAKGKAAGLGVILILMCCANGASQPVITRPPASEFTDVASLTEDVDPAIAGRLAAHFPGASEEIRQRRINIELKHGLQFAKSNLLRDIERFEHRRERSPETADLQTWLKETARKYEKAPAPY